MKLKDRIKKVNKNYAKLPKATNDKGEFVIIAEKDNSECYDMSKECLGVTEKGELIWSFLSGCSCMGENETKKVGKITAKIFIIAVNETVESFYNRYKVKPFETSYQSY